MEEEKIKRLEEISRKKGADINLSEQDEKDWYDIYSTLAFEVCPSCSGPMRYDNDTGKRFCLESTRGTPDRKCRWPRD